MQKVNKTSVLRSTCVLISLILLFSNWLVTTGRTQYDWSEYQEELRDDFDEIKWLVQDEELFIDLNDAQTAISCIIDGKLAAAESFKLSKATASMLNDMADYFKSELDASAEDLSEISKIRMGCIFYMAIFLLLVVSGIVTSIQCVRGKHGWYEYVFFVCQLILLLLCFFITRKLRSIYVPILVRVTAAAFFAVLLSFPSVILSKIPVKRLILQTGANLPESIKETHPMRFLNKTYGKMKASEFLALAKWTCPQCGAKNKNTNGFCSICGRSKPKPLICQNCGTHIEPTDTFCGKCGASIQAIETGSQICSKCGCSVDKDSIFCGYCGAHL